MPPTILVLGAAGETGRVLTPLLLAHTDARLILAGRDPVALGQAAATLADPPRVTTRSFDATLPADRLAGAFEGVDLAVMVAPVTRALPRLVRAACAAGADTLDIQFSPEKLAGLRALEPELLAAGRTAITDGGFHPGVPALMLRAVEEHFDVIRSARIGSIIQEDWKRLRIRPETAREFVEFITDMLPEHVRDGKWVREKATSAEAMPFIDFGAPFGRHRCFAMGLEEMRLWAQDRPGLDRAGFYVAGFNPVVDHFLLPIVLLAQHVAPGRLVGPLSSLMLGGLRAFCRPPWGTLLRLEAEGERGGLPASARLSLFHQDTYAMTAFPVAAAIRQWCRGLLRGPGLRFQALALEPHAFLEDMRLFGATVELQATSPAEAAAAPA
ncbi:MAG TPA: saccharopine dehydrogenase NADP-binding domain-containing protein [Longimicrobiales bacterium]